MKRLLVLVTLAASLLLSGCGPDCDAFCRKLIACGSNLDFVQCRTGCGNVGGDRVAYVNCVIDKTCAQIDANVCNVP